MRMIGIERVRYEPRMQSFGRSTTLLIGLLACGILATLVQAAMHIIVPMRWEAYSVASQTVSELSAIEAPTRSLWVLLGGVFTVLFLAFGIGVLLSAKRSRPLRIAGMLIIAHGVISLYWPPMHLRGTQTSLTDTLHIVWTVAAVLLMMFTIGFAAAALGKRFRVFSIVTMVVLLTFGFLAGLHGPRVAANLPTPYVGILERISIAAFFVWLVVFSVMLLRRAALTGTASPDRPAVQRAAATPGPAALRA